MIHAGGRRWLAAAVAAASVALLCPAVAGAWVVSQPGRGVSLAQPSQWLGGGEVCLSAGSDNESKPVPGCAHVHPDAVGHGAIQLSAWVHDGSAGAFESTRALPVATGLHVTFKMAAYHGQGGDGLVMFLQNGAHPANLGDTISNPLSVVRASLGYASRTPLYTGGLPNAILGVGFDDVGMFTGSLGDGTGCPTTQPLFNPHGVGVRGPGNGSAGRCLAALGSQMAFHTNGVLRAPATHAVDVTVSPRGWGKRRLLVVVDGSTVADVWLRSVVSAGYTGPDIRSVKTVHVGFAATSTGWNDNHDIWDIKIAPVANLQFTQTIKEHHFRRVGQQLHYRFVVTNVGRVAVSKVGVTHRPGGPFRLGGLRCRATRLAPDHSTVCTATHRVRWRELVGSAVHSTLHAFAQTTHGTISSQLIGTTLTAK